MNRAHVHQGWARIPMQLPDLITEHLLNIRNLFLIAQTLKITIQVSSFEFCGTLQSNFMTTTFIE